MQIMDVTVKNIGKDVWITSDDRLSVQVASSSLRTVKKAYIKRLMPGDMAVVEVGVQNKPGVAAGTTAPATAIAQWAGSHNVSLAFSATAGTPEYSETATSVNTHESPSWFRKAKYGIFIHWGIYSAPAYGGVGKNENYAEW